MRSLRRPDFIVPTLAEDGVGGKRRRSDRQNYEATRIIPTDFLDHWSRPDVRGLLHAMQGFICAYCGKQNSGLDVEHFRPKKKVEEDEDHGGYWWLAYDCSNYLLGCNVCNQKRKKTGFPLLPGAIRSTYETRETTAGEMRVLIDPCADPIEDWITIDLGAEDVTAKLVPSPGLSQPERNRIEKALHHIGVNFDPVLRPERMQAYRESAKAAQEKRWDDLRRSAMRHRPHSLVARIILRKESQPLPSAEEEAIDLLNSLFDALATLLKEIEDAESKHLRIAPLDERQLKALCWAIFILSAHPPAGDASKYEARLARKSEQQAPPIREQILSLFRRIRQDALQ
jgi:uncharacterized protein (TIGR02646 family)